MAQQKHTRGPAFALAGQIVRDWRVARRIQLEAMKEGREWLVPQARNVAVLLRRAAARSAS
jgi:hypothetical protein